MKSTVANYRFRTFCLRIVPALPGGATIRLTAHPVNLTMSNSEVYETGSGFDFSGLSVGSNFAAGLIDLEGLADAAGIGRDEVAHGFFDNARAYLFATDYTNPVEDEEELAASILGKATLRDERYVIQEFALVDVLSQTVNQTYAPTCQKQFGGQEAGGCGVDLGPITKTGTLTGVASQTTFTDTARVEADDYWTVGALTWTSGANAGLPPAPIKDFTGGTFTLYDAPPYPVQIGDGYSVTPGCRKRLEDCRDKWSNVVRFGGFPYVPVGSKYSEIGNK